MFYFQQWRPSWLGAGSSDTILKGDHPSTINLPSLEIPFLLRIPVALLTHVKGILLPY